MNKYITDYDTCLNIINKKIILASAYSNIEAKGKELIYNPVDLTFDVYEYDLILNETESPTIPIDNFHHAGFDIYLYKKIKTEEKLYDLSDAIAAYNSIKIPNRF